MPELKRISATIANGASLSGAVDLAGLTLVGIEIDESGWTAAALTFQASTDGTDYDDLYDAAGEATVASAQVAAGRYITLDPAKFQGVNHIKVRSGTGAVPVNQAAERTLALVAREL